MSSWLPVPSLLMALGVWLWLKAPARERASDTLERRMACGLLSLAALAYWCHARDDSRAVLDWLAHLALAVGLRLGLALARVLAARFSMADTTIDPVTARPGPGLLGHSENKSATAIYTGGSR